MLVERTVKLIVTNLIFANQYEEMEILALLMPLYFFFFFRWRYSPP